MIDFGIIGTSPITHQFIKAALQTNINLELFFLETMIQLNPLQNHMKRQTCLLIFHHFLSSEIDLVYIASPNSLHYQQAKPVLLAGKHAIVEKPMVSTPAEFEDLRQIASEKGLFLFEAVGTFKKNPFRRFDNSWQINDYRWAFFLCQIFFKMLELLAEIPGISFQLIFQVAHSWILASMLFMPPQVLSVPHIQLKVAQQLPSSVDLNGLGQLVYENFTVGIQAGKKYDQSSTHKSILPRVL